MVSVQHLLDQCRQRTTIVFGNLGRWPDRVTYYEPDYPYTILFEPNFGVHIPRSFGKTCGFDRLPRVADVYVKWLTWLDDWEMHRDDPVPWRIVGLQPWKRALEQHVQRSHEKALAHGMPSDVTLLDHI
ncbi:uncharacterized protein TNCV_4897591 [Trichonephila clavipes]|nr:uncharacterized protein TNCV_4897591 [Trichonephila clavipes]